MSRKTAASTDTEVRVTVEGRRFAAYVYHYRYEIRWTRDTLESAVGAAVLYLDGLDCDTRAVLRIDPEARLKDIIEPVPVPQEESSASTSDP